jgi:hypothetical protein
MIEGGNKMQRRFSILVGVMLILVGGLSLAFNVGLPWLGPMFWYRGGWQLWPLSVICLGLLFVLSPLLAPGRRGAGGLFIPGMPILATGAILFYANVFGQWSVWAWLWPVEVIALGLGFLFAAIYMRAIWLLLPAILIGVNGLMFQFCALTGLWEAWAVFWTAEPLVTGLALLLINIKQRSPGLFIAGTILCGLAAVGMIAMTAVFPGWWLVNTVGAAIFVLVGSLVLVRGLMRRPVLQEVASE